MTAPQRPSVTPEVIERFSAYHRKHAAWGCLHIVLDDLNVEDDSVKFCVVNAKEEGDAEGHALALELLTYSRTQRCKIARRA
jgi:hypothetical protein